MLDFICFINHIIIFKIEFQTLFETVHPDITFDKPY